MAHGTETACSGRNMAALCRKAVDHLGRGYDMPRDALEREVHRASIVLTELRDCLIHRLRGDASIAASPWRDLLDQVNRAISLVAGVEFPSGGLHRNYMETAQATLEKVRKQMPE